MWLHTIPEKQEQTRFEQLISSEKEVLLPDLSCPYLFKFLMSMGASSSTGMGQIPLSWQEIESWQNQHGILLKPWELSIIRKASAIYVEQVQLAAKADCPPPGKVVEQEPDKLAQHIKSILR